jgi:(p)ppGpp synthase/HD superfamily hydrolase
MVSSGPVGRDGWSDPEPHDLQRMADRIYTSPPEALQWRMAILERKYRLGKRFDDALGYALRLHRKQRRKGKNVPYAAHLLGTAGTVLDFGGDEAQAIAALLHDAAEDHGGRKRLEKIRDRFGRAIAAMVEDCTDTFEEEKPDWKPRKQAYISALPGKDRRSLLVSAADKLDNARAIVADLRQDGPSTLDRFNGRRETVWYFQELVTTFNELEVGPIAAELEEAVKEMTALVERPAGKAAKRRGGARRSS